MDFSEFDKNVNKDELKKQIVEAKENGIGEDTPAGFYYGVFEKFEIRATKDGRPMFSCQFRIRGNYEDGEDMEKPTKKYAKKCVFMNRVIYGTKNDANMINSLIRWMENLECDFDISFESYKQFNDLICDIAEDVDGIEFDIEYNDAKFNSISIIGESAPF